MEYISFTARSPIIPSQDAQKGLHPTTVKKKQGLFLFTAALRRRCHGEATDVHLRLDPPTLTLGPCLPAQSVEAQGCTYPPTLSEDVRQFCPHFSSRRICIPGTHTAQGEGCQQMNCGDELKSFQDVCKKAGVPNPIFCEGCARRLHRSTKKYSLLVVVTIPSGVTLSEDDLRCFLISESPPFFIQPKARMVSK